MERVLDQQGRWRNKVVAFRMSPEEDEVLEAKVKLSGLTKQEYVQLYFYCKGITDEMRTAFQKLANLTDGGKLTQGYRLFFKSSVFTQAENSTKSEIKNHLYRCLEEVRAFEMTIQDKWDS